LNAFLAALLATRARHERTRLMYVAATRARETLHLSAAREDERAAGASSRTALAARVPVAGARSARFQVQAAPAPGAPAARRTQALPLAAPPRRVAGAAAARGRAVAAPAPRARVDRNPRVQLGRGNPASHRHRGACAAGAYRRRARTAHAEQLEAQRAAVLRQLRREGVPERERAQAANLVLTALESTSLTSGAAGYSAPEHREAHSELALTGVAAADCAAS